MPTVRYANAFNSTHFTTCCDTAICDDQRKCPRCKEYVYPFYLGMDDREMEEMTEHKTRMARHNACRQISYGGF